MPIDGRRAISLRLPPDVHRAVKYRAQQRGVTMNAYLLEMARRAIAEPDGNPGETVQLRAHLAELETRVKRLEVSHG